MSKLIISTLLLVFVAVSTVYLAVAKHDSPKDIPNQERQAETVCRDGERCSNAGQPVARAENTTIVVYYFHRTARCRTCRALESNAREAIQSSLADELSNGRITIQALNVEEPGNRHYIEQYQITGPSLVLSYMQDGKETRWKNLDQIWALIPDISKYQAYIVNQVKSFIKGEQI